MFQVLPLAIALLLGLWFLNLLSRLAALCSRLCRPLRKKKVGGTTYDLVLDVSSIRAFEEGCEIQVGGDEGLSFDTLEREDVCASDRGFRVLNADVSSELSKLASASLGSCTKLVRVVGMFNRGKTFVMSWICDVDIPCGQLVETKGLCFLKPREESLGGPTRFLDTAGGNGPVSSASSQNDIIVEKLMTERFLNNIVVDLCDVFIVVVNELTWSDQEFLKVLQHKIVGYNAVRRELLRRPANVNEIKKERPIFVVHNIQSSHEMGDLLQHWNKRVVSCFPGQLVPVTCSEGKTTTWAWVTSGEAVEVRHFILGNKFTHDKVLRRHNENTIRALRRRLAASLRREDAKGRGR